jgi:type I restriction enzyme S subunit
MENSRHSGTPDRRAGGNPLPEEWQSLVAADCFDQVSTNGIKVKTKDCQEDGAYPVIDQGKEHVSGYIDDPSKLILVNKPLLIFGDHTRIIKWIDFDFVPGADGTKVLAPKEFILPRLAYYSMCALEIPDKGYSRHFKFLKELRIPLPPLAEQKVIAEKLDSLLAQVDTTKARLERIPDIIKRFRQSVLAAAVSGRLTEEWRGDNQSIESATKLLDRFRSEREGNLQREIDSGVKETARIVRKIKNHSPELPEGEIPENWSWTSFLESMEKVVDCHNKTAPYVDSGVPLIRTPDIRNGRISLTGCKYVTTETYEYWSRRCPPQPGDIIFTREAPMGEAGIVPDGTLLCMGQRMMLLRPLSEFTDPRYVIMNILSLSFQERMNNQAIGTGVKHLRVSDVESLTYPLPPRSEQTEIVRRVEELFAFADTIEQKAAAALERVNNLTQSILAKAFRGELTADWRAANPELISGDNSAEALLAKIHAEREALALEKKAAKKPRKKKA